MSEKHEARTLDKSTWGDGPWQTEPDRVDFEHAGLPCLLLRNRIGAWCGYAAVPPSHPWHGKGYSTCVLPDCADARDGYCSHTPEAIIEVHGGLTYANECSGDICHVPKPGEPDNVFWFGFDCAHGGDIAPAYNSPPTMPDYETYKDLAYVRAETERLAEQLAERAR